MHRFNEVMKHNIRELYKLTTLINHETSTPYIVEVGFTNNSSFADNTYIPDLSNYDRSKTIFLYYPADGNKNDGTVNIKTFDLLFNNYVNTDKEFTIQDMIRLKNPLYPINVVINTTAANTNYVRRNRGFFQYKASDGRDEYYSNLVYHQETLIIFLHRILKSKDFDGIINLIVPFDLDKKYSITQTRKSETEYSGVLYFTKPEEFDYLPYY